MSKFKPNKRHLREILVYFFNIKKSAAEAHRLLVQAYNEAALSERTCREWFQKFKNGDFDVKDKDRKGRPKIYEDAELKELLEGNSSQTQKELALTLEVTQQAVSHRLKSLGMIQKQGLRGKVHATAKGVAARAAAGAGAAARTSSNGRNTVANTVVGLNHIKARPGRANRKPGLRGYSRFQPSYIEPTI